MFRGSNLSKPAICHLGSASYLFLSPLQCNCPDLLHLRLINLCILNPAHAPCLSYMVFVTSVLKLSRVLCLVASSVWPVRTTLWCCLFLVCLVYLSFPSVLWPLLPLVLKSLFCRLCTSACFFLSISLYIIMWQHYVYITDSPTYSTHCVPYIHPQKGVIHVHSMQNYTYILHSRLYTLSGFKPRPSSAVDAAGILQSN